MLAFGALGQFALGEEDEGSGTAAIYGINYAFGQPVRVPLRLNAALNPALFYQPFTFGIDIGWFSALSEPKRFPQRLLEASQPYNAPRSLPQPPVNISWVQPFSEPKRFAPALLAGDQPTYAAEPQPEDQDFMGWFQPLGEPKRFKSRLDASNNPSFTRGTAPFYNAHARTYVIC